ncbi:predicted protein, partial [Nematostella vectensis]
YITECIAGPGACIDIGKPFYPGCCCEECLVEECSCLVKYGSPYHKQDGKTLLTRTQHDGISQPIFECNSQCNCDLSCYTKLVQKLIQTRLEVFKSKHKLWGLRTLEHISQGQFICEYAGEVLSYKEAKKRTIEGKGRPNYIITVKEHISGGKILRTHVDPRIYGNAGRFINHSCDPNLVMVPVRVDSLIPKLALFASKDIFPNEELSFDYSGGRCGLPSSSCADDPALCLPCYCNSSNCTGFLPYEASLF